MSWDFGVEIDAGGDEAFQMTDRNMTYNLSAMLTEALGVPFRDLDGAPCTEAAGVINRAIERMKADPERFKVHNPPNGWGDYDGALDSLIWLLECCQNAPKASIYVH